jgi:hypothetical protein
MKRKYLCPQNVQCPFGTVSSICGMVQCLFQEVRNYSAIKKSSAFIEPTD